MDLGLLLLIIVFSVLLAMPFLCWCRNKIIDIDYEAISENYYVRKVNEWKQVKIDKLTTVIKNKLQSKHKSTHQDLE